ncbi:right-handed parallel beta-helix repeat-containing protein [Victivallis sp. Marseille-Q1083]|uniref:right-handed parallel beta-helix repeat-containing protein n=1 Tax=Victivallis sp. Marseille-Q1083 TaxID=2717288 RepID=UPI00158B12D2|nr:right-handed parallel beta-helix repeat-containing protein [Victivallis sp. Marseille-Q1083]
MHKRLGTLVVAIVMTTTASLSTQAATYYVDASRPDDTGSGLSEAAAKKSIKAAVNAAKAAAGDHIIQVKQGTYTGADNREIEFGGKNIQLKSTAGAATTIIDLAQSGRFLYLHNNETKTGSSVEGFTVQNGSYSSGTAITLSSAGLTIKNCIFKDNIYTSGGTVSTSGGDIDVIGCKFINNSQASSGGYPGGGPTSGGALISNNGTVSVTGCEFVGNTGYNGGAILSYGANFTIKQSKFTGNTASGSGGALYVMQASSTAPTTVIENSLFTNNTAASAGGFGQFNGTVTIKNCTIYDNITNGTSTSSVDLAFSNNMSIYNTILIGKFSGTPGTLQYCCTNAAATGTGNMNTDPQLTPVGWLTASSPCINAGSNANAASSDLAGQIRPQGGTVDIGCYEWKDTDGDGIPDAVETAAGLNPNSAADASGDADNDGLSNLQEFLLGTDPGNADTDGDGILDGVEIAQGYNPLKFTRMVYVNGATGSDSNNGFTLAAAKKTLSAAVELSKTLGYENIIQVKGGTYTGSANKNLDFNGFNIILKSIDGAKNTVIDLENSGRFLTLQKGESLATGIEGLTIRNGNMTSYGTAVYITNAQAKIQNCIFENNISGTLTSGSGGMNSAAVYASGKPVTITGCEFINNSSYGSGMGGPGGNAGAVMLMSNVGSLVSDCSFIGNLGYTAGAVSISGAQVEFTNCRFLNNVADYYAGAIYLTTGYTSSGTAASIVTLKNCLLLNNRSRTKYSDLYIASNCSGQIIHSTIAGGSAKEGVCCGFDGNMIISNSIIQGKNTLKNGITFSANHNCVTDNWSSYGSGNITSAPKLTAAGYLQKGSPCINAGTLTNSLAQDINGVPRPAGNLPDIGCQEFVDADNDGIPDYFEIQAGLNPNSAADANLDKDNDGVKNLNEYLAGTDINKADTDGDGMSDGAEIAAGYDPARYTKITYVAANGNDSNTGNTAAAAKKTIGAAITASQSNAYENVIQIAAGTYSGTGNNTLDFGGYDIKLIGAGAATTIVDLTNNSRFLSLQKGETLASGLQRLTIKNGNMTTGGTAVYLTNAQLDIRDCVFENNISGTDSASGPGTTYTSSNAAVYASGLPIKVTDTAFINNKSFMNMGGGMTSNAGALAIFNGPGSEIVNCTFTGNVGYFGGAITLSSSPATLRNNRFFRNQSTNNGGAIYLGYTPTGPGAAATYPAVIENCIFKDNRARTNYSDIYAGTNTVAQLTNNTIFNGIAKDGKSCYFDKETTLVNNIILGEITLKNGITITANNNCVSSDWSAYGSNNLIADPLLTGVGYLKKGSPCINAGLNIDATTQDIDGVSRPAGATADIGAQEFKDTDNDGIPDNIEALAGLNPNSAADANLDKDNDGLKNLAEYLAGTNINKADSDGDGIGDGAEIAQGTDPLLYTRIIYVNGSSGNDANAGTSAATAKKTINGAIASSMNPAYDNIIKVAAGTYSGTGNKNLDFGGYDIKLESVSGADSTTIDLEDSGRFLTLTKGETLGSRLKGFTIRNGNSATYGTAVQLENSQLQIWNCVFENNLSNNGGTAGAISAAVYVSGKPIQIKDTLFRNNSSFSGGFDMNANSGAVYFANDPAGSLIQKCRFVGNSGYYGAIALSNARLTVEDSIFTKNIATYGGVCGSAGYYTGPAGSSDTRLDMINCLLINNQANTNYSDLYLKGNTVCELMNVTILGGSSPGESSCLFDGDTTLTNNILQGKLEWNTKKTLTANNNCSTTTLGSYGSGNITVDPLLTGEGFITAASPCVDAGTAVNAPDRDLEGVARPAGNGIDIGCREYKDSDHDGMPDGYEIYYGFDPNNPADATQDADHDGANNLAEFLAGTNPVSNDSDGDGIDDDVEISLGYDPSRYTRIIYADASRPNDNGNGQTPATAKKTLKGAVAASLNGGYENIIIVKPGIYSGVDNRGLSFSGVDIRIKSEAGPLLTIVDMQHQGQFLSLNNKETYNSCLEGLTIRNGENRKGGAINLHNANFTIRECIFTGNHANDGSCLYTNPGNARIINTLFADNFGERGVGGCTIMDINGSSQCELLNCTLLQPYPDYQAIRNNASLKITNSVIGSHINGGWPDINYSYTVDDYTSRGTGNICGSSGILLNGCLAAGSPCINAGTTAGAPATDLYGTLRPQGSGIDIGCEEYLDSDNDGMSDAYEAICGKNLAPNADEDNDGLTNIQEFLLGLIAVNPDSDGDGMPDGWEVANGTNPRLFDANEDLDGDGLTNLEEYQHGTLANNVDTDGDGVSDGQEVKYYFTDPLTADFNGTTTVVQTVNGSNYVNSSGTWDVSNNTVHANDRNGWLTYTVNIPGNSVYQLEVQVTQHNQNGFSFMGERDNFTVSLFVDDRYIGQETVYAPYNTVGSLYYLLPVLSTGSHTVKLRWDNVYRLTSLQINALKLKTIGGADTDGNGLPDWVDTRLENMAQVTIPTSSLVSPLCLEGGNAFDLDGISISGYYNPNNSTPAPAIIRAVNNHWYGDVPLNPTSVTGLTLTIRMQDGFKVINGSVKWDALNLAITPDMTIRKNDELKLSATSPNGITGAIKIVVDGNTYNLTAGQNRVHKFDTAGTYDVVATITPAAGAPETYHTSIKVMEGKFNGVPLSVNYNGRTWFNPDMSEDAFIEADSNVEFSTNAGGYDGRGFRIYLKPKDDNVAYLTSRLYEGGPILDSTHTRRMFYATQQDEGYVKWLETYPDGSRLIEGYVVLNEVPADIMLKISLIAPNIVFQDGTRQKILTAADFNENGIAHYNILLPPNSTNAACHEIRFYQGGEYLSTIY